MSRPTSPAARLRALAIAAAGAAACATAHAFPTPALFQESAASFGLNFSTGAVSGGGCTSPVGAYAEIEGRRLLLRGFYADEDAKIYRKGKLAGPAAEAAAIGRNLAAALLEGREAS